MREISGKTVVFESLLKGRQTNISGQRAVSPSFARMALSTRS